MNSSLKRLLFILLVAVGQVAFAQLKTVSGVISDENNNPLFGAAVVVKGTDNGVTTDFDGKYSISAREGDVLSITFIGYTAQEVTVGASNTVNVKMVPGEALETVVLVGQGVRVKPKALTYSIQEVGSELIEKSREVSVEQALSAKAAGVQVTSSSGSVGASANVRIRGNTTILGGNGPLYVVDGIPINNSAFTQDGDSTAGIDFSSRAVDINSADIASLVVLKGVAAQTLYGIRAANGVILITTKKGKSGKARISLNNSVGFSQFNKAPDLQRVYAQGRVFAGALQYRGPETFEGDSWGPLVSNLEYNGDTTYPFDSRGALVPRGTGNGQAAQTFDHLDFFKTGFIFDTNVEASGGKDGLTYRASVGRLYQEGTAPNEEFERKTFRVDLGAKLSEKLSLDLSANYANSGGNRVQRGSNISGIMLGLLRTAPTFDNGAGLTGQAAADNPASYYYTDGGDIFQRSYRDGIYNNPYFTVARNKNVDDVDRIIGKIGLTYKLSDWITANSTVSVDTYAERRTAAFDVLDASFGSGRLIEDNFFNKDVNWNVIIRGEKSLSEKLGLSFDVGYDGFRNVIQSRSVQGDEFSIPGFFNLINTSTKQAFEGTSTLTYIGAFATATLSIDDKIFISPQFRNDWASTLPTGKNSFQSYSVGASYVFTEDVFKDNDVLSFGKLRFNYGKVGNAPPVYATQTTFDGAVVAGDGFIQTVGFPAYDAVSFERSTVQGNPDLKPAITKELEYGIELEFLKRRLRFDATYYDKETTDQILLIDTPSSSGFGSKFGNSGVVSNKGIELSLSADIVKSEDFNWELGVNWTAYSNVVEELAPGVDNVFLGGFTSTSSRAIAGESFGAIFGTRYARDASGNILIGDNGFPIQDATSGVIGDPIPDWQMGISNSFTYKGISLSVLFDIRKGGDVWCGTCGILDFFGVSAATLAREDSRVFTGVVQSTGQPNTQSVALFDSTRSEENNFWRRYGFGGLGEQSIYDGSWVRLREVSLGYSLPKSLLGDSFIEGIDVSIYGRNLWLSTDYPGVDPETNLNGTSNAIGLDYFNQPNTKSYGFNIKLNF